MNGIVKRAERRKQAGTAGWRTLDHPEYDRVSGLWNRSVLRHPMSLDKPGQRKVRARALRVKHAGRVTLNGKPEFKAVPRVAVRTLRLSRRIQREYAAAVEKQQAALAEQAG